MTTEDLAPALRALAAMGESISSEQEGLLARYRELLAESNARYSLVSRGDTSRIVSRHFVESVELLQWIPRGSLKIADVGSGGGLPGIVLQILRPESTVALIERRRRKQVFLRLAVHRLGLSRASVFSGVDELVGAHAPPFDRVVARAVGSIATILPVVSALLRVDGLLITPKGSRVREDLDAASLALAGAGFHLEEERSQSLTSKNGAAIHRAVLIFRKSAAG